MLKLIAALLAIATIAMANPVYTSGSHGGCYTTVVSKKTGKSYRKYVSADHCGKAVKK